MVNLWHDIDRKKKDEFNAIIEIPKGSRVKYEIDHETGMLTFDRVVFSEMRYSTNYAFIPQSLWDDGDAIDILVMSEEPLVPGCIVKCRPIGIMGMNDNGEPDSKILAVPVKDPRFKDVKDISDVGEHFLKEIIHFFSHYKDLEGKKVDVDPWKGAKDAIAAVERSFELYDKEFKK